MFTRDEINIELLKKQKNNFALSEQKVFQIICIKYDFNPQVKEPIRGYV